MTQYYTKLHYAMLCCIIVYYSPLSPTLLSHMSGGKTAASTLLQGRNRLLLTKL